MPPAANYKTQRTAKTALLAIVLSATTLSLRADEPTIDYTKQVQPILRKILRRLPRRRSQGRQTLPRNL